MRMNSVSFLDLFKVQSCFYLLLLLSNLKGTNTLDTKLFIVLIRLIFN